MTAWRPLAGAVCRRRANRCTGSGAGARAERPNFIRSRAGEASGSRALQVRLPLPQQPTVGALEALTTLSAHRRLQRRQPEHKPQR